MAIRQAQPPCFKRRKRNAPIHPPISILPTANWKRWSRRKSANEKILAACRAAAGSEFKHATGGRAENLQAGPLRRDSRYDLARRPLYRASRAEWRETRFFGGHRRCRLHDIQ